MLSQIKLFSISGPPSGSSKPFSLLLRLYAKGVKSGSKDRVFPAVMIIARKPRHLRQPAPAQCRCRVLTTVGYPTSHSFSDNYAALQEGRFIISPSLLEWRFKSVPIPWIDVYTEDAEPYCILISILEVLLTLVQPDIHIDHELTPWLFDIRPFFIISQ